MHNGFDLLTGQDVAIKVAEGVKCVFLIREIKVYERLSWLYKSHPGFLQYHFGGMIGEHTAVLVLQKGGIDIWTGLEEKFKRTGRCFPLNQVVSIGMQAVQHLRDIHRTGYIHNDVKPDNFLYHDRDEITVQLIDFGESRRIADNRTNLVTDSDNLDPVSRLNAFSSVAEHRGQIVGKREDLEALGYSLVLLFRGRLPWGDFPWGLDEKFKNMQERYWKFKKERTPLKKLCRGMGNGFVRYFEYLRGMKDLDDPDYEFLINSLKNSFPENI